MEIMPKDLNEEDFFTASTTSAIFQVGVRRLRDIAAQDGIVRAYYSRPGQEDLVCFRVSDVLRVATNRHNEIPPKLEVVPVGETYPIMRKTQDVRERVQAMVTRVSQGQPPVAAEVPSAQPSMPAKIEIPELVETLREVAVELRASRRAAQRVLIIEIAAAGLILIAFSVALIWRA